MQYYYILYSIFSSSGLGKNTEKTKEVTIIYTRISITFLRWLVGRLTILSLSSSLIRYIIITTISKIVLIVPTKEVNLLRLPRTMYEYAIITIVSYM